MLRRTKADQVKRVYEKMVSAYPDCVSLDQACERDIKNILYPLGLQWRVPAFCDMVHEIRERYGCQVPDNREELKRLPGVGDYVAGAVLSIAYRKREWIVDANVVRLFKRFFGVRTSKEGRRDKHVIEMAKTYAAARNPRVANLAILDFAAVICTDRNPKHRECPIRKKCKLMAEAGRQE
jgi:A/G-specific adenine glycosylase